MKKIFLVFFLFIELINLNHVSSNDNNSYFQKLRKLWDEDMVMPSGRPNDEEISLKHCAKSDYKYYSHILTGSEKSFNHYISTSGSVR